MLAQSQSAKTRALESQCVLTLLYRGEQPPVGVLPLITRTGGTLRIRNCLSDRLFQSHLVVAELWNPAIALPPHHLVVNLIANAEASGEALACAERLLGCGAAPVINAPAAVLATGRCTVARRLASVPGLIAPKTVALERGSLAAPGAATLLGRRGLRFPLLLRSPGFHQGMNFLRVEAAAALPAAVAQLPGERLTAIEYLDARGRDGKTRKYRAMTIDGQLYPLHAAVSGGWKVHYASADMGDCAAHRAEDADFLADMRGVIGPAAMAALEEVQKRLGLDYGGIDFGLNARGEVLLFEANAAMGVFPPGDDPRWAYRRAPAERIFAAVREMLMGRASSGMAAWALACDAGNGDLSLPGASRPGRQPQLSSGEAMAFDRA